MLQDALIYEFGSNYFVIQRSQQGKSPRPEWGPKRRPSDNSALTAKVPIGSSEEQVGGAVLEALDNYDRHPPSFDSWELKELRKQLCDWVGVRGYPTLVKNSRLVMVLRDPEQDSITVIPFDNHNLNPWESQLTDQQIVLSGTAPADEVGRAVETAFAHATYHPERKDPPHAA